MVKRAAEVAAAGFHNLLYIGPPGSGKTMAAKRIPTILPALTLKESVELSKVYSIAGLLPEGEALIVKRPFRNPHHTMSAVALVGGGRIPKPGEISLAGKGVLFLDELPEFQRETLEILRQPLEEQQVVISRVHGTYTYPADFQLVCAMNPCKCGYYPDRSKCRCTADQRFADILVVFPRPLLDRIDICVETPQVEYEDLGKKHRGESSASIRARVEKAMEIQKKRYEKETFLFNSQLSGKKVKQYCILDEKGRALMEQAFSCMKLSARSYEKILKVARTIADWRERKRRFIPPIWRRRSAIVRWIKNMGRQRMTKKEYWYWLCHIDGLGVFGSKNCWNTLRNRRGFSGRQKEMEACEILPHRAVESWEKAKSENADKIIGGMEAAVKKGNHFFV